jgi:peptidoglycan/xylan/chitin deacetylase (PgdA/CDA1 family)
MNIKIAGVIATSCVIILGIIMVSPVFLHPEPRHMILLSFSIENEQNLPSWCSETFSILRKHNAGAAIFISGSTAEQFPTCASSLPNNVEVGSQGYNYVDIPAIPDYTEQLEEVKKGKETVDRISGLDSKLFRAPYGKTDSNVYSLLSRAGILADFSYEGQYNKFHQDKFIWFKVQSYKAEDFDPSIIGPVTDSSIPIIVTFSNSIQPHKIDQILTELKAKKVDFVSPSKLADMELQGDRA